MSSSVKHFLRRSGEMVLGMATPMTVPMAGWMADRGHGRRANTAMPA